MDNINIKSNIRDITKIQKLKTLIKKELWEHNFRIFKAPIAFLVFAIISKCILYIHSPENSFMFDYFSSFVFMVFFVCIMASYFLHCFYDDKKNGSLSFFRSMPYSDGLDLTSKLIVGFIITPITFYLYYEINLWLQDILKLQSIFYNFGFFHSINFLFFIIGILYFSPILGYFLVVSTSSKRSPYLLAFAPFLAILLFTVFVSKKTDFLWKFIFLPMKNGFNLIFYNAPYTSSVSIAGGGVHHVIPRTSLEVLKYTLLTPSFWYSIFAFAIFTALTLAIRKKSDV